MKNMIVRQYQETQKAPKVYHIAVSNIDFASKYAEWGTFGPNGDQPLKFVRLIDCSTDHLRKICQQIGPDADYWQIISHILKQRNSNIFNS